MSDLTLTPDKPWPGPAAYTERDASFFFGRDAEAAELLRLVRAEPLSVLFSLSGLGKTSLIQAGLFPRLRNEGFFPVRIRLEHSDDAPSLVTQVLRAVARAAAAEDVLPPDWDPANDTMRSAFFRPGAQFSSRLGSTLIPVLVLDQFEEAWTLTRTSETARSRVDSFLTQISELLDSTGSTDMPIRIVIALREDQLAPLEALRHIFQSLRRARLRILPFTKEQAGEVVVKAGGTLLAPKAAEAIVETFATGDALRPVAEPVLLSIFCWRLNESRVDDGRDQITPEQVEAARGRFIESFYDTAFEKIRTTGTEDSRSQADSAERFVEDLVDAAGFRTSAGYAHAETAFNVSAATLDILVTARLLHPIERTGGQRHLELIHDRLAVEAARRRRARRTRDAEAEAQRLASEAEKERARAVELDEARTKALTARKKALALMFVAFATAIFAVAALVFAKQAQKSAEDAKKKAEESQREAADAKTAMENGFKVIVEQAKPYVAEAPRGIIEAVTALEAAF
jgi:hypothetical protein